MLKSKTFVDEEGCMVTEKVYESESCTDSEEELKMKTSSIHRPSTMTVKKEPKEERKGPKKGTAALGKANRQVSITGFFQRKWTAISVKSETWSGQRRRPRQTDSHLLCKFILCLTLPISKDFFHPVRFILFLVFNQRESTWKQEAKEYLRSCYVLRTFS